MSPSVKSCNRHALFPTSKSIILSFSTPETMCAINLKPDVLSPPTKGSQRSYYWTINIVWRVTEVKYERSCRDCSFSDICHEAGGTCTWIHTEPIISWSVLCQYLAHTFTHCIYTRAGAEERSCDDISGGSEVMRSIRAIIRVKQISMKPCFTTEWYF